MRQKTTTATIILSVLVVGLLLLNYNVCKGIDPTGDELNKKKESKECHLKKRKEVTNSGNEVSQENLVKKTFRVSGNCGMCKETIEGAASSVKGVHNAIWDVKQKKITVAFDSTKTDLHKIEKAIAESGYDTENITANEKAYKGLHKCCQYNRMASSK
ncbi:heavy-metal-associated domain-containing protein [Ichthyobacterium seriolicida]|uniref:Putative Co/Zn/Cd efflux system membrane fusion protein n=1 Tax=Ichthyobacterium seriolicida TaxID=242600 RepID=A0A1J1E825_9FLAO|nr:heavy-metal-associated domain-containing protein [Ichthyobacterium seriolicida]BAV94083.1 putative Co/Zn/Cd efflux system membrane fusion protein [Ichthyobacterium seriolicida]